MISGPEIMDMWVGRSEGNLRRIFAVARRNAPAVIFFDEFDSIAIQRSNFGDGGSRTANAVVAQLLTEMDGFRDEQDILVIGTTNRIDIIDEALLRPSRFQPIEIGLPDEQARRKIAEIHAKGFRIELPGPRLLDLVVEYTQGFSGDEIRAVFQGLARKVRRGEPLTTEATASFIGAMKRQHEERREMTSR
jgi:SpoVK/Ycf46/Vps4 family AAA+-type ATPase